MGDELGSVPPLGVLQSTKVKAESPNACTLGNGQSKDSAGKLITRHSQLSMI